MAGLNMQMEWKTRLCQVGEKLGYFHAWEYYSKPLEASPLMMLSEMEKMRKEKEAND